MKDRADLLAAAKGTLNRDAEPVSLQVVPDPVDDASESTQPMAVVPVAPAPLAGRQMGFLDQMRAQAGHTVLQVRGARHLEGSISHRLWHGQPPSMAQQADYVERRVWVKPGHEGGVADRGGVAYHTMLGNQIVAVGNSISAIGARPLRAGIAYGTALAAAEAALCGFGDSMIAIWVAVIHVAVITVVVLALSALTARSRDDSEPGYDEPATEPEEN